MVYTRMTRRPELQPCFTKPTAHFCFCLHIIPFLLIWDFKLQMHLSYGKCFKFQPCCESVTVCCQHSKLVHCLCFVMPICSDHRQVHWLWHLSTYSICHQTNHRFLGFFLIKAEAVYLWHKSTKTTLNRDAVIFNCHSLCMLIIKCSISLHVHIFLQESWISHCNDVLLSQ